VVGFQAELKQRMRNLAAVIVVALALLWPAFVNGEPFYMPDTSSYIRGADGAIHELMGVKSVWSGELQKRFAVPTAADPPATAQVSTAPPAQLPAEPEVVLKGRSIYYGAFLYLAQLPGNFWAMAVFQSLLCAIAIIMTIAQLRNSLGRETRLVTAITAGLALAVLTPVGYFADYLMPDVLGGLALLAAGHLVIFWDRATQLSRLFWFVLLAFALISHTANILLIAGLAAVSVIGMAFRMPASRRGFAVVGVALFIAVLGQFAFAWGVRHATGAAPVRPPFLAARIIEDGPGYDYLRERCPEVRLIYCRVLGFRIRESDSLLWSADPREGIFQALPPNEQREAAQEQNGFVLAVLKEHPIEILASSARAFFQQLGYFKLESFNYTGLNNLYFRQKLPEPFLERAQQSKAYQDRMPVVFVEWATVVSVLAALAAIFWTVRKILRREKRLNSVAAFLLLLIVGILINAAICGAFSTPRGRYQMRLIWVLPLAALATSRVRVGRAAQSESVVVAAN